MSGAVLNHLWQSTLFTAVVGLLALALRKNSAAVRHALWFAASVKFLVPFAVLTSVGSRIPAPAVPFPAAPALQTLEHNAGQSLAPFESIEAVAQIGPAIVADAFDWTPVWWSLWGLGFLAIAALRYRDAQRVRNALRASTDATVLTLPMHLPVDVRTAPGLLEPGVAGWGRPVVLLPEGIEHGLSPEQMRAVLAHELAHVRRHDNWTSAVHMLTEAVFWFHPLVWWIGARLLAERERACDEAVLQSGCDPKAYAEVLLEVCKRYAESPLGCVAGVSGSDLKQRVKEIIMHRNLAQLSRTKKILLAVAGLAAIAVPLGIGLMHSAAEKARMASRRHYKNIKITPAKDCGASSSFAHVHNGVMDMPCALLVWDDTGVIRQAYTDFAKGGEFRQFDDLTPLVGGPGWLRSDRFDIHAETDGYVGFATANGPMMQTLLESEFGLRIHREKREIPVYELTMAEGGPQFQKMRDGSCAPKGPFGCVAVFNNTPGDPRNGELHFQGSSMSELAMHLGRDIGRQVIDKTGLDGRYEFRLRYSRNPSREVSRSKRSESVEALRAKASDPNVSPQQKSGLTYALQKETEAPSIFSALPEQLGLRLEPATARMDVLVIDSIHYPGK